MSFGGFLATRLFTVSLKNVSSATPRRFLRRATPTKATPPWRPGASTAISRFPSFPSGMPPIKTVEYVVEVVKDITALSKGAPLPQNAGKITSRDKRFQLVFEQMAHWADDGWPVLLQGEKGTGKKSFARALHQRSGRAEAPFHVFHCVDNCGRRISGGTIRRGRVLGKGLRRNPVPG